MKKIVTYESFDGYEFETEESCRAYEKMQIETMREMNETYSFYDEDMNQFMNFPEEPSEFENVADWLDGVYDKCEYVRVNKKASNKVTELLRMYFGYVLPKENCGLYQFNRGWVKVAD